MTPRLLLCSLLALGLAACSKPANASGGKLDEKLYTHFGAGVTAGDTVAMPQALARPAEYSGKPVRVSGEIGEVCQVKGCWMMVGDASQKIRVRFKDYGFFVPKDSAGRQVVMEGLLEEKEISVEQQKHYLEDAGKKEEAAQVTAPRKELTFLASGVAIRNPEPAK